MWSMWPWVMATCFMASMARGQMPRSKQMSSSGMPMVVDSPAMLVPKTRYGGR